MYPPSLIAQLVNNWPAIQETSVQFLCREDPLEKGRKRLPTPVFLPGESHGLRSLVATFLWGYKRGGQYLATTTTIPLYYSNFYIFFNHLKVNEANSLLFSAFLLHFYC